ACDKFIYTEILRADASEAAEEPASNGDKAKTVTGESMPAEPSKVPSKPKTQKVPVDFIAKIIDDSNEDDGWIQLGALGSNISKLRPAFDARLYGFKKLSDLIK